MNPHLPGGKGRPARKAARKCGSLDVSQIDGPPLSVTGRVLPFFRYALRLPEEKEQNIVIILQQIATQKQRTEGLVFSNAGFKVINSV
jgi:hypothetical protein